MKTSSRDELRTSASIEQITLADFVSMLGYYCSIWRIIFRPERPGLISALWGLGTGPAAIAVYKLLHGAGWRVMRFLAVIQQLEGIAELVMQLIRAIPFYRQAAALNRPIFSESGDNDMAARFDRTEHGFDISGPILGVGEKMKNGTIVPDIILAGWQIRFDNIRLDPANFGRAGTQALSRRFQGMPRQIEHRHIGKTICQQVIDQRRCASADIDDRRIAADGC